MGKGRAGCCEDVGAPVNDADDVVQEVLLAAHLKRGTWARTRPIGPGISKIVHNTMIDTIRRQGRHTTVPIDDVVDMMESAEHEDFVKRLDSHWTAPVFKKPRPGLGWRMEPFELLYLVHWGLFLHYTGAA
jgi:DNA-directed RNA polymerase specialized sigma24 family protein